MKVDVVVAGGAMVGATVACALGQSGLRVAVVEAREPPGPLPEGDFEIRVSALSRASERILKALGAWRYLPASRLGVFREMHVWDAGGGGSIHFDSAELGEPLLGHIVENNAVQHALEARIADLGSVTWLRPAKLEGFTVTDDGVRVTVDGDRVDARVLVGADGARSRVRDLAGIQHRESDYGQTAVVASVTTSRGHSETAWQRFLAHGPLAFLPLPGKDSTIVWSTRPEHAEALLAMEPEAFGAELERAFESRLGAVTRVGARGAFPLRSLHALSYTAPRVVLVGDAAHTIHPLAGQGANLGFLDAAALAEVIGEAHGSGRDPGARLVLRRYERWRKGHNLATGAAMDGFRWLFGEGAKPLSAVRSLGLDLTDRLGPVKHRIMSAAMGLEGDLPALARPAGDGPRGDQLRLRP